jgi:hypothetical protein
VQKPSGATLKGLNTSKGGVKNVTVTKPNLTASVKLIVKDEDQQKGMSEILCRFDSSQI